MIRAVSNIPTVDGGIASLDEDEKHYDWQMSIRANYLLIGDTQATIPVITMQLSRPLIKTDLRWVNRGELIAGSFMSSTVWGSQLQFEDVDIYFKEKEDVDKFVKQNKQVYVHTKGDICYYASVYGQSLNLIFGVHYDDAADLISHFDIRACSIALDPSANTVYFVDGALGDCSRKRVVYNPLPHNTSIARLVKYAKKGFDIDPYQRLFLVELLKSDMYNPALEISTGYRAVAK